MMFFKKLLNTKQKGDYGENKAAAYLKRKGYKILERNYRTRFGEIDIIARKKDVVAFVEVKARSNDDFGTPDEAVDFRRQCRMCRTAKFYMMNKDETSVRFDVIEVYLTDGRINHYEDAFYYKEGYGC